MGGNAIIKGEISEEWHTKATLLAGHEAEVRHYIADLDNAIRRDLGCDRIVALCDEANLLAEEWQKKLIGGHLRELSDLGIQFVFVAGYVEQLQPVHLTEYFDFFLELQGIPKSEFRELLTKHYPDEIGNIQAAAMDAIYAFTNGNPRMSLDLILEAFEITKREKRKIVRVSDTSIAIDIVRKRRFSTGESLKAQWDSHQSDA